MPTGGFAALANLVDGFAGREDWDALEHARAILVRGGRARTGGARARRQAAVGGTPSASDESVFSDSVFLANARAMIGNRRRVVGGVPTGYYRDCVAVGNASGWCCSGTLVARNVVVTAAHCDAGGCKDRVLIGDDTGDPVARVLAVSDARSHPDYRRPTPTNDICVLILERDSEVEPRALATADMFERTTSVRLAGYGHTNSDGTAGYGRRRMVDVPLAANDPKYGADSQTEFVAGAPFLDRDSCHGDSGGPAYLEAAGNWYLVGATSRATKSTFRPCGDGGIYTYLPAFVEWIKQVPGGRWA